MSRRSFPRLPLALLGFFLVNAPRAQAEPIQWSYQGGITATSLPSTYGPKFLVAAVSNNDGSFGGYVLGNQVEFADVSGSGAGSASVTAFQMRGISDSIKGPFSRDLHTFDLTFTLTDAASGASGSVAFRGTLDGFMTRVSQPPPLGSSSMQIKVGFTGELEKTLTLGDNLYKVSIDPFTFRFGQELANTQTVTSPYQGVPISVQVSEAPEPSTLLLGALGLSALGLRAWRRRNAARAQPA